jgi:hypothetical protein
MNDNNNNNSNTKINTEFKKVATSDLSVSDAISSIITSDLQNPTSSVPGNADDALFKLGQIHAKCRVLQLINELQDIADDAGSTPNKKNKTTAAKANSKVNKNKE